MVIIKFRWSDTGFKLHKPLFSSPVSDSIVTAHKINVPGCLGSALISTRCVVEEVSFLHLEHPFVGSFPVEIALITQYHDGTLIEQEKCF